MIRIQKIVGTLIYYSCIVDYTILPDSNTIAEQQTHPTNNTEAAIKDFLDYAATNPTAVVQFKSSDMVLHIDSDA